MVSLLRVRKKCCRVPETPTSTSVEMAVLLPRNQSLTQSSWPEHHRKSKSRGPSPCAAQSSVLIRRLRICRLSTLSRHFGLQRLGSHSLSESALRGSSAVSPKLGMYVTEAFGMVTRARHRLSPLCEPSRTDRLKEERDSQFSNINKPPRSILPR
jgi:hypothetical protein